MAFGVFGLINILKQAPQPFGMIVLSVILAFVTHFLAKVEE